MGLPRTCAPAPIAWTPAADDRMSRPVDTVASRSNVDEMAAAIGPLRFSGALAFRGSEVDDLRCFGAN